MYKNKKLNKLIVNINNLNKYMSDHGEEVFENLNPSPDHSIAIVDIPPGKTSLKHYHPVAEESYYITSGKVKVVVNGKDKILSPGDTILIPTKAVHQLLNDFDKNVRLVVTCTPRWTFDGSVFVSDDKAQTALSTFWANKDVNIYSKTNISAHEKASHSFYELLENAAPQQHSLALVELNPGASLQDKHYAHQEKDECYVILGDKVDGYITLNSEKHELKAGDVITAPADVNMKIVNQGKEPLQFLVTCAAVFNKPELTSWCQLL